MLYVDSRKSLRVGKEKNYLLSARKNTRQTCFFAECQRKTLGKRLFAECFLCNTQQKCCFPGARGMTLDKPSNTWHLWDFP